MWSASLMFSPSAKFLDDSISCASAQLWVARRWSCGTFKSKQALVLPAEHIQNQGRRGRPWRWPRKKPWVQQTDLTTL